MIYPSLTFITCSLPISLTYFIIILAISWWIIIQPVTLHWCTLQIKIFKSYITFPILFLALTIFHLILSFPLLAMIASCIALLSYVSNYLTLNTLIGLLPIFKITIFVISLTLSFTFSYMKIP